MSRTTTTGRPEPVTVATWLPGAATSSVTPTQLQPRPKTARSSRSWWRGSWYHAAGRVAAEASVEGVAGVWAVIAMMPPNELTGESV